MILCLNCINDTGNIYCEKVKPTSKVLSPTLYPLSNLNARKPASGSAYSQKPKAKEMTYNKISQLVHIMLRT